jgi:hypothetical protein
VSFECLLGECFVPLIDSRFEAARVAVQETSGQMEDRAQTTLKKANAEQPAALKKTSAR